MTFLKLICSVLGGIFIFIAVGTLFYKLFEFFHITEPYFWLWLIGVILLVIGKYSSDED